MGLRIERSERVDVSWMEGRIHAARHRIQNQAPREHVVPVERYALEAFSSPRASLQELGESGGRQDELGRCEGAR